MRERVAKSWRSLDWELPALVLVSAVAGALILSIFYSFLFLDGEAEFKGDFRHMMYWGLLALMLTALIAACYIIWHLVRLTMEVTTPASDKDEL